MAAVCVAVEAGGAGAVQDSLRVAAEHLALLLQRKAREDDPAELLAGVAHYSNSRCGPPIAEGW